MIMKKDYFPLTDEEKKKFTDKNVYQYSLTVCEILDTWAEEFEYIISEMITVDAKQSYHETPSSKPTERDINKYGRELSRYCP